MDVILLSIQVLVVFTNLIPELKDVRRDKVTGIMVDGDGKEVNWYTNPKFIVGISICTTALSITFTIVNAYFEA